ncbi:MAG: hypothetical protein ACFFEA_10755 [Candidatus Thorarchaeota archaeon]
MWIWTTVSSNLHAANALEHPRIGIAPVYKREGFSDPTIKQIMGTDIEKIGEALKIDGSVDDLADDTQICFNEAPEFRKFIKKNMKSVVSSSRTRKK